jgi:uncharacterized protein (TIGR02266 family)
VSRPRAAQERRITARKVINREFASVDELIHEYVNNISRTGAFIRSDDPLPIGTKVQLRFTVILDELETLEGIGEVVRVVPPGGKQAPGMGVVFTELTGYSRQLLERIMIRR